MISSIDEEKCTGCGSCVKTCALDVFRLDTRNEKIAPCMAACPARNDLREIHYLLQQSRLDEALDCLKLTMPFPALAGRLCQRPCERPCSRHALDESVNIGGIESFLGERDLARSVSPEPRRHVFKVAVIGAGIAGLSAAWYLTKAGFPVTVFEAAEKAGGHVRNDAACASIIDVYAAQLQAMGADLRLECRFPLTGPSWREDLEDLDFRAIVIAAGSELKSETPCGLELSDSGRIKVDSHTFQSSVRTVFAVGDAAIDNASDVLAMVSGRRAAQAVGNILQGANADMGMHVRLHTVASRDVSGMEQRSRHPVGNNGSLSLEGALEESLRCLTCGSRAYIAYPDDCMTCFACETHCPAGAIDVDPFKEFHPRHLDRRFIGGRK